MATEEKIIKITIDDKEALVRIDNISKKLDTLGTKETEQKKQLNAERKELIKSLVDEEKLQRERVKTLIEQEKLEQKKIQTTNASNKQAKVTEGYLNEVRASVKALEQAYFQLTEAEFKNAKSNVQGTKGAQVIASLKEQRAVLAEAEAAYGKHNLNVGNYSSATKMLGINLGQVMKEMPNFAISARIGIMSLTNNLPMLAESIKAVKLEQKAMIETQKQLIAQGKIQEAQNMKIPNTWKMIGQSIFGLTGIMSLLMVAMQIWGDDLLKWIGSLFKMNDAVKQLNASIGDLKKIATDKLSGDFEKARLFALDYNKAVREGNKDRIKQLIEIGKKEYNLHEDRLKLISINVNNWRQAFKEYLNIARDTYFNEALAKKKSEVEMMQDLSVTKINMAKKALEDYKKQGVTDVFMLGGVKTQLKQARKDLETANEEMLNLNKIFYKDVYNLEQKEEKKKKDKKEEKKKKDKKEETFDFEQKLREANAKAVEEDIFREAELRRSDYQKRQDELNEAYSKKLVTEKEYNTLSVAYSEQLGREISDIYQKYAKKEIDIIAKQFDEEKKFRDKKYSDMEKAVIDRQEEAVNKARNEVDVAMMYGEESFNLKLNQLDKEAELEKLKAWEKLENAKASEKEKQEALVAIDKYYAGKKTEIEQELTDTRLQLAAQVFGGLSNLLEEGTVAQKIAATAEATINTYLAATAAYAAMAKIDPIVAAPLAAGAAILAGLANVKKIWEVKTDIPSSKSNVPSTTSQVTEKYHTGKEPNSLTPNSQLKSDEIHSTLLKAETVLDPRSSNVFNSILGNIKMLGGSENITKSVGINADAQTQVMEIAFTRALARQKAPILDYSQFTTFVNKQVKFEQNTRI